MAVLHQVDQLLHRRGGYALEAVDYILGRGHARGQLDLDLGHGLGLLDPAREQVGLLGVDGPEGLELFVVLAKDALGPERALEVVGQGNGLVVQLGEPELAADLVRGHVLLDEEPEHFESDRAPEPGGLGCGEKELAGLLGLESGFFGQRFASRQSRGLSLRSHGLCF